MGKAKFSVSCPELRFSEAWEIPIDARGFPHRLLDDLKHAFEFYTMRVEWHEMKQEKDRRERLGLESGNAEHAHRWCKYIAQPTCEDCGYVEPDEEITDRKGYSGQSTNACEHGRHASEDCSSCYADWEASQQPGEFERRALEERKAAELSESLERPLQATEATPEYACNCGDIFKTPQERTMHWAMVHDGSADEVPSEDDK
jgi:hypothetical protein